MYKSCIRINQFAMFLVSGLYEDDIAVSFCCTGATEKGFKVPGIKFDETPEKTMSGFIELRERLIAEANGSYDKDACVSSLCEKCPLYHASVWKPSKKIELVSFAMYPAPCNLKCVYCNVCINHHTSQNHKFVPHLHGQMYEKYLDLLEYARECKMIADEAQYEVGSGEIAIHPYKDRILDFVKGKATCYLTNCVVYNDKIATNLAKNRLAYIYTSLDAGTAQTWRRIKGADNFDKTIKNIEKYCKKAINPSQVVVKYIIQPGINTNTKDYDAITRLVKQLGINRIVIASEIPMKSQKQFDDTLLSASDLLAVMYSKGIDVGWDAMSTNAQNKIIETARGKMESTSQQMKKHVKKDQSQLLADMNDANALFSAGKYEEASKVLLSLTHNEMTAPFAYFRLAELSNLTGDPSTAKNLYYKAFELKKDLCSNFLKPDHPNYGYVFKGKMNEEKVDACPLCGSTNSVPRWCYCVMDMESAHVQAYNPVRTWMYCGACHHMYAEEFPSQEAAASSAFQVAGEAMQTNTQLFALYSEILSRVALYPQGNELLEIGVGGSEFALVAQEMGYNVHALDVSEGNVRQAIKYGIDAQVQDIMKFETDKKWDVIIMGDVIEHVADPVITLDKVEGLLQSDGVLWLSTPNFEASYSRVAGHNDGMRKEASHKNYFSRLSIISLLARFNLIPVDYRVSNHYKGSMEIIAVKANQSHGNSV